MSDSPDCPDAPPTEPLVVPPPMDKGPVTEGERIRVLDVIRGLAIFGIFMVNMKFFAGPLMDALVPMIGPEATVTDRLCWLFIKVFFELKFISIFSLLFGMGMVLQMRRGQATGRPFSQMYLRRTLVLMLIGLAHALLLWYGDILLLYSVIAFGVFWLRNLSPKVQLWLAAAGIAISIGVIGCFGAAGLVNALVNPPEAVEARDGAQPARPADVPEASDEADDDPAATEVAGETDPWSRFVATLRRVRDDPGPESWRQVEMIAYREGPMAATLLTRAATFGILLIMMTFGGFLFRIVGMFLLGMALMKLDFFSPQRRRWHWALCLFGLGAGLAGELGAAGLLLTLDTGEGFTWPIAFTDLIHQLASVALCLGYVGAVTLVVSSGIVRPVMGALAAVGRLALTNYLLQSVVATGLMYWWGLGLFGEVTRVNQILLVVLIYVAQVAGSVLWLRWFTMGPCEWAWRTLTYLKLQPLVRRA